MTTKLSIGSESPWGTIQTLRNVGLGIISIITASHGGYFVPKHLCLRIPLDQLKDARNWSNGWGCGWFEEDCCAAYVVACFYEVFQPSAVMAAQQQIKTAQQQTKEEA